MASEQSMRDDLKFLKKF